MHDTLAVTEVKRLQKLKDVESHVIVRKAGVQGPEIGVVDGLKYKTRSLALVVAHHIQKSDNIRPTSQILKNLDLTLNLLLLDRLENLDHAFLVVDDIDALEHLRVFSAA